MNDLRRLNSLIASGILIYLLCSLFYGASKTMKYLIDITDPSIRLSLVLTIKILFSPLFLLFEIYKLLRKHGRLIKQDKWEEIFIPNQNSTKTDNKSQQKTSGDDPG